MLTKQFKEKALTKINNIPRKELVKILREVGSRPCTEKVGIKPRKPVSEAK